MGQKHSAEIDINIDEQKHQAMYNDFIVHPTSRLSIKQYIPLLLGSITKNIKNMLIPHEIIQLILSYYPLMNTYKIYRITRGRSRKLCVVSKLDKLSKLCSSHPLDIYYGQNKYFVKTSENELYMYPGTYAGGNQIKFTDIDTDDSLDIMSNGICTNHCFVVTQKKKIYGWGTNISYLTNSIMGNESNYKPMYLQSLTNVFSKKVFLLKIICGRQHSLFLGSNKRVYSIGSNIHGECGFKQNKNNIYPPQIINKLKNISDICCGSTFNLCLDNKHGVYCFGDNSAGYLGLSHNKDVFVPILHPYFATLNTKYIRCGQRHCLYILYGYKCYLSGSNSNGQCDHSEQEMLNNLYPPPQKYKKLVQNGWCGSNHTVVLTIDNELISFGSVNFNWNRNENQLNDLQHNQYIVRVIAGHNATFLVVR